MNDYQFEDLLKEVKETNENLMKIVKILSEGKPSEIKTDIKIDGKEIAETIKRTRKRSS